MTKSGASMDEVRWNTKNEIRRIAMHAGIQPSDIQDRVDSIHICMPAIVTAEIFRDVLRSHGFTLDERPEVDAEIDVMLGLYSLL